MANLQISDPIGTRMGRLFHNFWRHEPELFRSSPFTFADEAFDMKLDVAEKEGAYVVRTDLPGVSKEDIKVDIDGNLVSISAEVKRESEKKDGETVVYSERYQGRAYRSFTLDSSIDAAKSQASYKNGVLELTLPKLADGNAKRLQVS